MPVLFWLYKVTGMANVNTPAQKIDNKFVILCLNDVMLNGKDGVIGFSFIKQMQCKYKPKIDITEI